MVGKKVIKVKICGFTFVPYSVIDLPLQPMIASERVMAQR
jgi:hypothetical protein